MIKLDAGNVLLKPSHRRQLMGWLKRTMRLGSRLGNFFLSISLRRTGRLYEVRARVNDSAGAFNCKCRQNDLRGAVRDLVRMLTQRLHTQCLQRAAMA